MNLEFIKKFAFWRSEMRLSVFAVVLSLLNMVFYNMPFLNFIVENADSEGWQRGVFIVSFVCLLVVLNFLAFYLFMFLFRIVGKVLLAFFSVLSATCVYFIRTYHTMMDESMMNNVFNTRYSEASGFFSWELVVWILIFGVLPAIWIVRQKVNYGSWRAFGAWCGSTILVTVLVVLVNINKVLWISSYDTELGGYVMPWSYTVNTCRMWAHRSESEQKEIALPDAKIEDQERCAMVLVIGESARKANFSLYGYQRQTNPRLSTVADLHVLEAKSCATYTTAGVKSILEYKPTDDLYEILPNYMFRTGVDVVWRTSNWGEPPVHIDEYMERSEVAKRYGLDGDEYDEVLLCGVKERIEQSTKDKVLIILHTSTSHGPDYQRYPKEFEVFTPICKSVEEAEKHQDLLINAYDNSIVYTDHLLRRLIDSLRTIENRHCAMIFVSDHGESLGENGLFMHGVPMNLAPKEQYEIPFLVWTDGSYRTFKKPEGVIDQHYVFHSAMRWLGVNSPIYDENLSLFK